MFTLLHVKTETLEIVINFFLKINSLHVNINNILLWKMTIFKKISKKGSIAVYFL